VRMHDPYRSDESHTWRECYVSCRFSAAPALSVHGVKLVQIQPRLGAPRTRNDVQLPAPYLLSQVLA
jgi:hypothetical protein